MTRAAREIDPDDAPRAVREYLDTLDDEAFGAATTVKPKSAAHIDPVSQRTAARKGPFFFSYSTNYLIDTDHSVIVDVDACRANKTAEMGAMRKTLDRTEERVGMKPDWIAADTAYGSSDTLVWRALKRQILPFIPVFDKGERTDGTFSRSDFTWDDENDRNICPGGQEMKHTWRTYSDPAQNEPSWKARRYRAPKSDCTGCASKQKWCPLRGPCSPSREIRNRSGLCPPMHRIRVQCHSTKATKESRDALRTSQTHPWLGAASIT